MSSTSITNPSSEDASDVLDALDELAELDALDALDVLDVLDALDEPDVDDPPPHAVRDAIIATAKPNAKIFFFILASFERIFYLTLIGLVTLINTF